MNLTKYRRIVSILAIGGLLTLAMILLASQPGHAAGPWYVAPGGNDGNDCLSPVTPCATINGAIDKASSGDTIYVAMGTYTGADGEVVLVDKSVTLSGGWDDTFSAQPGTSTVNGEGVRRGITVDYDVTATFESFTIQNGYAERGGGVYNYGNLTLGNTAVSWNTAYVYQGGGVYNDGNLTLNSSTISSNNGASDGGGVFSRGVTDLNNSVISGNTSSQHGGGIWSDSTLILNNSTVNGNTAHGYGGGISNNGTLVLNNSTVSGNQVNSSTSLGGGIMNWGNRSAALFNSTVSNNSAGNSGGGLYNSAINATLTIQNSLIGKNTAGNGPDCWGNVSSQGYNLLGNTTGCSFAPSTGDLVNTNPNLGMLTGRAGAALYHPLLLSSPAIDAGDPTGCRDDHGNLLSADQRGVSRIGRCDIGAYEYSTPGSAASVHALRGTPQHTTPLSNYAIPLGASVLDSQGSPVESVPVTFFAPQSGPSGTFTDTATFTTTAMSDQSGIATAVVFTANERTGSYVVTATMDSTTSYASFLLTNTRGLYAAPEGDNSRTCLLPDIPCASIGSALGKASPGDKIFVATGVYTSTGSQVLLILKDIVLSGGWNATFTQQDSTSTVDGQGTRLGVWIGNGANVVIERFMVRNASSDLPGGAITSGANTTLTDCIVSGNQIHGVYNTHTLTMTNCTISDNTDVNGSGIWNDGGTIILNSSTVSGNRSSMRGGGILNGNGLLILDNCTISGNTGYGGGGVENTGTLYVNSSTFYGNSAVVGGGIANGLQATIQNSILAGNTASVAGPDCSGEIDSSGYNLLGDTADCTFSATTGDMLNVAPKLGPFEGSPGYHPLLWGSPAINAGNPGGCTDHLGNPLAIDQRGFPRLGRCDIGAYEVPPLAFSTKTAHEAGVVPGSPLTYTLALRNGEMINVDNIAVTDALPTSIAYISNSLSASSGSFGYSEGVITWTGSVAAGEAVIITFGATVSETVPVGTVITNTAVISGGGETITRSVVVDVVKFVYLPLIMKNR